MLLDLNSLKDFFSHSRNVFEASENLPLITSSATFKDANQFTRDEISKLHESLYKVEEGEYKCFDGRNRDYFIYKPLALDIADFLNDDDVENQEVETATEQIIQSFLNLLTALNKFIKLKNQLPVKGFEQEKNTIEESFTELTNILGTIINPLGDHIKEVVEDCIYEGPALDSIRRQMDKTFHGQTKTIRELLRLDKSSDGSIRKKPTDKKSQIEKAKSKAQKEKKTQRSQAKQARKNNRKR